MKRIGLALLAFAAGISCGSLTDPALPPDAQPFVAPPVYTRWWTMVESCSGLTGSLNQIQWFSTPSPLQNPENKEEYIEGYWSRAGNRVVLISNDTLDGGTVRHEMLHSLVKTGGHPRAMFLQKCGGLVDCAADCVREAGPAAPIAPGTPDVLPSQLEITSGVSPATPSASVDGGLATFTISVHNPFSHPVVVVLSRTGPEAVVTSYRFDFRQFFGATISGADQVLDSEITHFAAGETKRLVIDFAVAHVAAPGVNVIHGLGSRGIALPAGSYSFRGAYGGAFAPDLNVELSP